MTENDITIDGDMVFMKSGQRKCFNVTAIDDDEIEYRESFYFTLGTLNNSLSDFQFNDSLRITVIDNDGQLCPWHDMCHFIPVFQ